MTRCPARPDSRPDHAGHPTTTTGRDLTPAPPPIPPQIPRAPCAPAVQWACGCRGGGWLGGASRAVGPVEEAGLAAGLQRRLLCGGCKPGQGWRGCGWAVADSGSNACQLVARAIGGSGGRQASALGRTKCQPALSQTGQDRAVTGMGHVCMTTDPPCPRGPPRRPGSGSCPCCAWALAPQLRGLWREAAPLLMVGTPWACWHLVLPPHLSAWAARPGSVPALCPASRGQSTGRECPGAGLHRGGAPWAGAWVGAAAPGSLPGQGGPAVLRNTSRGRQRSSGLRKSGGAHPQCLPPFDIPLCFVNQQELEEIRKCGMKNFRNIQVDEANLLTWQGLIVPVSTGQLPSSSPDGAGRRADGRLPGPGKAVCADRTPSADQPPPPLGRAGGSRLVLCLRSCPAVRLSPVLCAPASWFPPGTPPSPAPPAPPAASAPAPHPS